MPINKFKFVSPGVQVAEIDNSQLPAEPVGSGPVIIGRSERGPAMRPVRVNSFSEFVTAFGMPWPGRDTNDIWRNGNKMAPSYGVYAAQAYLRNSSPLTFVRLLGEENADAGTTQGTGKAGWTIGNTSTSTAEDGTGGGNYGLFLLPGIAGNQTGTLAAIFYCDSGAIILSGTGLGATLEDGTAGLIRTKGTNFEMQAQILNEVGQPVDTINFNFNRNSQKYIRKVFNTNPTTTNERISGVSGSDSRYFLGETFDRDVDNLQQGIATATGEQCGVMLRLAANTGSPTHNNRLRDATPARTGWVLSQYLGNSSSFDPIDPNKVQPLFRVNSLNAGAWESQNFKIAISEIRASTNAANPYGTFTVEIRKSDDNDAAPQYVERFAPCNLNPVSQNYVGRKIGDKFTIWDNQEARYREYGTYENKSKYIYIEVSENVANSMLNEALVPFGFQGIPRWKTWCFSSGSLAPDEPAAEVYSTGFRTIVDSISDDLCNLPGSQDIIWTDSVAINVCLKYPNIHYRLNTKQGNLASPGDAYFGYDTGRSGSINVYDESNIDIMRPFPNGIDPYGAPSAGGNQTSSINLRGDDAVANIFTLDEVRWFDASLTNQTHAQWWPGSKVAGTAISSTGSDNWKRVLSSGFDRFTLPFFGGFDGMDILESNPFNSVVCGTDGYGGASPEINYAYNSVKMAIDTVADPEVVDSNLMSIPGNYEAGLTNHLLYTCEKRADSLAVIDIAGGYIPNECSKPTFDAAGQPLNRGSVAAAINDLRERGLNSSYGTAYYPWVQSRDGQTSQLFYAPPSIAAIGVYSSAQNTSELWFAPAGFTRGGLTEGDAGIPIVGTTERLNSKDRDSLYEANINPIATFPAEGIVIFGQKTLQVTPSALDRVNVRRLMIYIKKEISRMAARLLFDQNVSATWARFTGQANPFLESIKQRLGLEAYKVILDTTTTTPDLIDRNIMYAKIFLKPARAIEYIAIDFVITNAGASFED